jgi:hypothetical protein
MDPQKKIRLLDELLEYVEGQQAGPAGGEEVDGAMEGESAPMGLTVAVGAPSGEEKPKGCPHCGKPY